MAKISFNFSECPLVAEEISDYYRQVVSSIECKYSPESNQNYTVDFFSCSEDTVNSEKRQLLKEISVQASLCLLSFIESRFRIDFIIRCQGRKKDFLSKAFRGIYNPAKRLYKYSLVDDIIENWKNFIPEQKETFDRLIDAFNYRNWIAHGRYWHFKDNPDKFTFDSVWLLNERLDAVLGDKIMTIPHVGDSL